MAGRECGRECQWLVDYFGGIFKTFLLSWGCCWSEGQSIAITVRVFPFVVWLLIQGLRCSVSRLSIGIFGFCWFSFHLSAVSGF